jgi:HEAT repeat protein
MAEQSRSAREQESEHGQEGLKATLQRMGNSLEVGAEAGLQALLRLLGQEGFSFDALATMVEVTDARIWTALLHHAAHAPRRAAGNEAAARRLQSAVTTAFTSRQGMASDAARQQALLDGLHAQDPETRCLAVELLGRRGDAGNVPAIAALLNDRDDRVRAAAVRALAEMSPDQALPYLLRSLERYDIVAAEAVNGLVRVGKPAVEPLLQELRSPNEWARWHAAKALGGIGDVRAAGPLIAALTDDASSVRWEAVYALAQIGPSALEPLLRAIETTRVTPWFAEGVARVLSRISADVPETTKAALAPLQQALQHQTADVEAPVQAARALEALRAGR